MKEEVNLQEITTKSGADVDRNLDDHDPDEHGDIPDRKPDHELETHGGLTLHVHHVKDSKGKTKHTIINHVNDPAGGGTFVVKGHAHPKHILSSYNRAEREDMDEEVEQIDEAVFDSKDAAQSVANKLKAKHDDGNYHVKADNGKHRVVHAYYPNSKVKKEIANLTEEVGPSTSRYHVLVHKSSSTNVEKAHHAVSGAGNKNFRPGTGLARMDKPGGSHDPTGGDHHVIHAPDHATHENLRKNLSDYGARATIVDTHTGKREDVHEEVEQVNERSREDLISQIKGLKKPAIKHGFDWPSNDSTDKTSTKDLKSFHKSARSVIKQDLKAKAKADVQEVAMPQNAADWQAMINHQIKVTGHPVATDAQFRATTVGKDISKVASQHSPEDMLNYATAQGGTVKQ
jgi:hypothetical protein